MQFEYNNKNFTFAGTSANDHIYKRITNSRTFYEIELLKYIAKTMSHSGFNNTVAIDVGANIGNHSVFLQSFVAEHIICVEPNPNTLPTLKKNLDNNIRNYTIYENGLGETSGRGNISLPDGATNNIGMAQLIPGSGEIEIITLDYMVADWQNKHNNHDPILLIKVDVEGMELSVLKGAIKTINKYKPELFLEAASRPELKQLKSYLKSIDYLPLRRFSGTPVYHFSYKPSISTIIESRLAHFMWNTKRKIKRKIKKIKRKFA